MDCSTWPKASEPAGRSSGRDAVTTVRLPDDVHLDLIPAGSPDDYERRVQALDWDDLYERYRFGELLEDARTEMKESYDIILVDSRTGVSDVGGICAVQLPDILMMVLTANDQSLYGTDTVAVRVTEARQRLEFDRLALPIVPILCRFDAREERDRAAEWKAKIAERLAGHMDQWLPEGVTPLDYIEQSTVPYVVYWSFGEGLPVLEERSTDPDSMAWSIETIAAIAVNGADTVDELVASRNHFIARARGSSAPESVYDVFISSTPRRADMARSMSEALRRLGLLVFSSADVDPYAQEGQRAADAALSNSLNLAMLVDGALGREQLSAVRLFLAQLVERTDDSRIAIVNVGSGRPDLPTILSDRPVISWSNEHRSANELTSVLGLDGTSADRLRRILADRVAALGPDHADSITARFNISGSLVAAGRHAEAESILMQVLADRERILGPDHPDTLTARNNLARVLADLGRHDEALALAERVLADRERILGPDHPDTLTARNNLARVLADLGRHDEALPLAERALADSERILGPDHPDTITARNNLANRLGDLGRHEDAFALAEQVLADREHILGPDHLDTIWARHNLAARLAAVGRYDEALELAERVLADREHILGPDHLDTIWARHNLAARLAAVGRSDEALELAERVLADRERILGPDRLETNWALDSVANRLAELGRYDEAVPHAERVLADRERLLDPKHPAVTAARRNLERLQSTTEKNSAT